MPINVFKDWNDTWGLVLGFDIYWLFLLPLKKKKKTLSMDSQYKGGITSTSSLRDWIVLYECAKIFLNNKY